MKSQSKVNERKKSDQMTIHTCLFVTNYADNEIYWWNLWSLNFQQQQ